MTSFAFATSDLFISLDSVCSLHLLFLDVFFTMHFMFICHRGRSSNLAGILVRQVQNVSCGKARVTHVSPAHGCNTVSSLKLFTLHHLLFQLGEILKLLLLLIILIIIEIGQSLLLDFHLLLLLLGNDRFAFVLFLLFFFQQGLDEGTMPVSVIFTHHLHLLLAFFLVRLHFFFFGI